MKENKKVGFTHDNIDNKSVDWYTPEWIFKSLNLQFDLDPCHPKDKITWIPCNNYYSLQEDGLKQDWNGLVWLNPPYGKYTSAWLEKMHQHRNGIAITFARTDTKWFHNYCAKADQILFLSGRVKFVDGLGVTAGSGAGSGSMLISWGDVANQALYNMKDKGFLVKNNS